MYQTIIDQQLFTTYGPKPIKDTQRPHQGKYIFNIHHHGTDDKHSSNIPYKEKADQIPETDEMSQW